MSEQHELAARIRDACVGAALTAYEQGGISGLCAEGRWELAILAMRTLDLEPLLDDPGTPSWQQHNLP